MSLQPHAPTASESADFWADVPIEQEWVPWVPGTHRSAPLARSTGETPTDTKAARKSVRSTHGKPKVCCLGYRRRWVVDIWKCCPDHTRRIETYGTADGTTGLIGDYDTQPEALAAALAHVAEHHTPKPDPEVVAVLDAMEAAELAQKPAEDAFWERHYADAEADVAAFNLECRQHTEPVSPTSKATQRQIVADPEVVAALDEIEDVPPGLQRLVDEHAEPVGNPDKHRMITVTPDQLEAVTRIFDAFGVHYSADDETPLQRAHRAEGPRA